MTEKWGIHMRKVVKVRSLKQIFLGIFILSVSLCLILILFVTDFSVRLMHAGIPGENLSYGDAAGYQFQPGFSVQCAAADFPECDRYRADRPEV